MLLWVDGYLYVHSLGVKRENCRALWEGCGIQGVCILAVTTFSFAPDSPCAFLLGLLLPQG